MTAKQLRLEYNRPSFKDISMPSQITFPDGKIVFNPFTEEEYSIEPPNYVNKNDYAMNELRVMYELFEQWEKTKGV